MLQLYFPYLDTMNVWHITPMGVRAFEIDNNGKCTTVHTKARFDGSWDYVFNCLDSIAYEYDVIECVDQFGADCIDEGDYSFHDIY